MLLLILATIISLISAIASGVYAYQTGNVAAETICVGSVLILSSCLFGAIYETKFEGGDHD